MQKKYTNLLLGLTFCSNLVLAEPTIESMKPEHVDAVKEIIAECWFELHPTLAKSLNEMRRFIKTFGWLKDIDSCEQDYMNGAFFVMIDKGMIIGMGAV